MTIFFATTTVESGLHPPHNNGMTGLLVPVCRGACNSKYLLCPISVKNSSKSNRFNGSMVYSTSGLFGPAVLKILSMFQVIGCENNQFLWNHKKSRIKSAMSFHDNHPTKNRHENRNVKSTTSYWAFTFPFTIIQKKPWVSAQPVIILLVAVSMMAYHPYHRRSTATMGKSTCSKVSRSSVCPMEPVRHTPRPTDGNIMPTAFVKAWSERSKKSPVAALTYQKNINFGKLYIDINFIY